MLDDKLLILKFKLGDSESFKQIYLKYRQPLLKLAVSLVHDVNSAEDAVQDVFVNFAGSAGKIRLTGNLKSYLNTCLVNRIRNILRDRARREYVGVDESTTSVCNNNDPQQWALVSEQLRILSGALSQLPVEQREAVALHLQENMTFRKIAALQGTSVNTVQGRYRYGLEKLRKILENELPAFAGSYLAEPSC